MVDINHQSMGGLQHCFTHIITVSLKQYTYYILESTCLKLDVGYQILNIHQILDTGYLILDIRYKYSCTSRSTNEWIQLCKMTIWPMAGDRWWLHWGPNDLRIPSATSSGQFSLISVIPRKLLNDYVIFVICTYCDWKKSCTSWKLLGFL